MMKTQDHGHQQDVEPGQHQHDDAEKSPAAIIARVDRLTPGDKTGLASLLQSFPRARPAILAAAASRLGNATVQGAMSLVGAESSPLAATAATQTANAFYAAFAQRDSNAMRAHYAPTIAFHDPLFGHLEGTEVMRMWTSIMPKANPFEITPSPASAPVARGDGSYEVRVVWDAFYGLGSARIHNHSTSTLVIKDGVIIEQRDEWDLDRWTAQALPLHLGGHVITDLLTAAAAHGYIKVVDLIARHTTQPQ